MKHQAVVFSEPWKIEVQQMDFDPEPTHPHDLVVENKYSIISAGTEMACLAGIEGWFSLPGIPGYGACGVVMAKGSEVEGVEEGDAVYTYGGHAAHFRVDTTNRYQGLFVPVPDSLGLDRAVFCRMAGISIAGVRTSNIELGDWVLVTGMGLVGNLAAQLAALQGARVVAADVDPERLNLAKACGLEHTLNTGDPAWKEQVREWTRGRGVAALIEASGHSSVLTDALDTVCMHGEVILLGSPRAKHETNITDTYQKIHLPPFLALKGALEWRFPTWNTEFSKHSIERNIHLLMELIQSGELKIDPLYSHKIKPAQAEAAYHGLREKRDEYLGVVFDWTG